MLSLKVVGVSVPTDVMSAGQDRVFLAASSRSGRLSQVLSEAGLGEPGVLLGFLRTCGSVEDGHADLVRELGDKVGELQPFLDFVVLAEAAVQMELRRVSARTDLEWTVAREDAKRARDQD